MGASSVVTIALSIVRQKFIAVTLGAEGVGLLGLLVTGLTLAVTLFSVGLASSGVRYIAKAKEGSEAEFLHTRSALVYGSQLFGLLGGALFVLFRAPLAAFILHDPTKASWVVWLGVALWAAVASGGQLAVINGLRRIGDLAKANVWGAALGTGAALVTITLSGETGLVAAIVAPPLATWLAAWWLSKNIPTAPLGAYRALWRPLRRMVSLGVVFSASLVLSGVAQFASRLIVQRALGLESVGYFQAAWSVSNVYLSFVLTALAAEYYPRISALSDDKARLNNAVDTQITVALLLAGPVILGMILFAPWAVTLLYSDAFGATVAVLRWQLVGDVLKVAAWAVAFLLLAREARWPYFVSELLWSALYVAALFFLVPTYGLPAAGLLYALCYALYLGLVVMWAGRATGFRMSGNVLRLLGVTLGSSILVTFLAATGVGSPGWFMALAVTLLTSAYCLFRLQRETGLDVSALLSKVSRRRTPQS